MDRPILFNGDMVRAILSGAKTQTRRPFDPLCFVETTNPDRIIEQSSPDFGAAAMQWVRCPYGSPGDRLWVRETWRMVDSLNRICIYKADPRDAETQAFLDAQKMWKPSIHMPRWASRLTLDIVSVRVERLHDISEADALAEGFAPGAEELLGGAVARLSARDYFQNTWQEIYGFASWDANPWVWVVAFRKSEVR